MENKLILSFFDDKKEPIALETLFDIINLYGNKKVAGIEINSTDLDNLKKCAKLCKKNKMLFRCHFPLSRMSENATRKYLNCINEIAKDLRYKVNVVFHSDAEHEEMSEKIEVSKEYINNILKYVVKYNLDITVSLENLNFRHDTKRINMDKIDIILKEFENLKFTYDIGHDIYDNKKASNISKLQAEKINNVHIHSIVKNEDHHMITKDPKDFNDIQLAINNLRNINYTGPIVLEYATFYIQGKNIEERIINFVKSFNEFYVYFNTKN